MATTKITNAIALTAAINALKTMDQESVINEFSVAEHVAKLEKMLATTTKKREGSKSETPSQRENREVFMPAILAAMAKEDAPITAKWVTEHVNGIMTTQKASALLGKLVALGKVERIKDSKQTVFKLITK